jgi:hypothetical protein
VPQRRRPVGRALIRALAGVHQRGAVAHGSRQEPVDGHPAPALARIGPVGNRARVALNPKSPQFEAGMRTDPPPSLPCAAGTIPPATTAPAPPEEPPGVRPRSQGLRVGPP